MNRRLVMPHSFLHPFPSPNNLWQNYFLKIPTSLGYRVTKIDNNIIPTLFLYLCIVC